MRIKITLAVLISLVFLAVSGCAGSKFDSDTIHQKNAFITKLTRKTHVAVRKNITDSDELLGFVNEKFPAIMNNFTEYSIVLKNDLQHVVVLMCDKEKTKALVEDVVCTAKVDAPKLYEKDLPCDFQVDVLEVCK